jgi:hypothetical protein
MRLPSVERPQNLRQRLLHVIIRLTSKARVPDVVRTILFRPRLFGNPYSELVQAGLRGPSPWSVGERELIAAFTADRNRCRF